MSKKKKEKKKVISAKVCRKVRRDDGYRMKFMSEYTFRSIVKRESGEPVYIDGVIDLLFVCGDTVYVVDFKTDSQIAPAAYISQLACYRDAALRLCRASQCRTLLYYLRHDRAVDITAETAACELRCIV